MTDRKEHAQLAQGYYLTLASLGPKQGGEDAVRRRAMGHILSIAAKLTAAAQGTADRHDIHLTDLYVLMLLFRSGAPHVAPALQLQRSLGFTAGGMTRRLDSMIRKNLVRRIRDTEDGRSWNVELTEAGKRLSHEIYISSDVRTRERHQSLPPDDWKHLQKLLASLAIAM
jgi:DNA-binding MarR family transcriptional regulator